RALTLEEYLDGDFNYKTYFPYWISRNEYLHQSAEDDIILHNAESGSSVVLLTNSTLKKVNASNYMISADHDFILLESNYSKVKSLGFGWVWSLLDSGGRWEVPHIQSPALCIYIFSHIHLA
uniref:Uncharacterized protein n=1 Tax=Varanus komodoensis TaxID=61221 RepID=A0A8D2L270_VARKO